MPWHAPQEDDSVVDPLSWEEPAGEDQTRRSTGQKRRCWPEGTDLDRGFQGRDEHAGTVREGDENVWTYCTVADACSWLAVASPGAALFHGGQPPSA
jgi:hypothetical protein